MLVGVATGDDAAVYKLDDQTALVQTVDFFPPVVDDPYNYGAISAANSLSDIYATGACPITALNIVAFPDDLPKNVLKEVLRGGAEKAAEANVPIVGGHTIKDPEPKYGLAVTGLVHPERALTNSGAKLGDHLVLTKPLGSGIITTAAKFDKADPEVFAGAVSHMLALNKDASEAALLVGVNACTDISGFGLLGHLRNMASESGVSACVFNNAVPLMKGAETLAIAEKAMQGGAQRNMDHHHKRVILSSGVSNESLKLLYDPQTSGGLLLSIKPSKSDALLTELQSRGISGAAVIGEVTEGETGAVQITN